jgi:hypothetical protein
MVVFMRRIYFGYPFASIANEQANVDVIRSNDGATRAPHETCLRRESDPRIG